MGFFRILSFVRRFKHPLDTQEAVGSGAIKETGAIE
jgi:hypothetical protein